MQLDPYEKREPPTDVSAALAAVIRPPDPLPALVQTLPSSDFVLPYALRGTRDYGAGREVSRPNPPSPFPAREGGIALPSGATAGDETPLPASGNRGLRGWGRGEEPPAVNPFAVNLDPIASGQSLVQDPFTLEALLQSKPPSRLSFPPNIPSPLANLPSPLVGEGQGGGSTSSGGGGGASSAESNQGGGGASSGGDSAPGIPLGSLPAQAGAEPGALATGGPNAFNSPTAPVAHAPGSPGNSGNPGQPKPDRGHGHPQAASDPMWVLDANKGIVVTPGTPDNEFSNWSMDLRAQVSGATVSTYSWNTSNAPDATNITGSSTYRLQFTWSNFGGTARTDTISVTETPTVGSAITQTLTFTVAGTTSPAYTATPPTSWSTWSTFPVITPDALTAQQAAVGAPPYASLGLTEGDVQTYHNLPDYNPGVPALGLLYSSVAANALPIFITHFQIDPTQAAPPTVKAQLTLNSVAGSWVWYNTSQLNPGDIMEIPLQGDATALSTGRYSWSISVTANYGTPVTTTYSGNVDIVNSSGSPFGAGWSLDNLQRIWPVTGGVILELPGGLSLWFANGQTAGTFVTPPGDTSTLTQNQTTLVYTRTLKDGTKINFSSSGYQTSIVDTNGNTLTFGYNGSNQLTTLTDFNNLVTTIAYNGSGKASSITDPASRITTLAYDINNVKLTGITDPDSALWQYGYDSANRLTTLTDPRSKITTFGLSSATGRVTTVTRADTTTESLTAVQMQGIPAAGTGTQSNPATPVLAAAAVASFTDPRNNIWNTNLDWLGFGEPTQATDPLSDLANTYVDANGFPWLAADPLGRRFRYFFDSKENPTTAVLQDDATRQYTFNTFSEVTKYTDPESNVSTYGYDTNGNLTQIIDALVHTTTMTYTTRGFLSTVTDPLSHTTTYGYDTRSRQTSVTDALLHTATMAYDSASDMTGQTDMRGNATTYTFDAEGRLLTTTLPGTPVSTTTYGYDSAGNLTTITDPLLHTTTLGYDNLNRLFTSTDPLSHTTTYGYDNDGNLVTTTDPLSHITSYTFDAANRLTAVTDPLSHTTTYGLDAAGQRITVTDALGHITTYSYTQRGQVSTITTPGQVSGSGYSINYSYCSCGMTKGYTISPSTGSPLTVTIAHDALDRVTSRTDYAGNTTTYGYDAASNLTSVTDPLSHTTTYGYDADNRLISVTDALSHTVTYGYDNVGNRTTITDALSRVTTYGYDSQNRLTSVTDPRLGVTTYTYDQASRRISVTDSVGNITTYGYDNANRVTTVTDPLGHNTTYSYDNADELTSVTDRNGRQTTYSYDAAGKRTGETWVLGSYTATYGYDAANRLTSESDTFSSYTLGYDNANDLTSVDNNGTPGSPRVILSYTYDGFNRRISRSDNLTSTVTTSYSYDSDSRLSNVSMTDGAAFQGKIPNLALSYDVASRLTTLTRTQASGGSSVSTTYGYDNANRLTGITHSSSVAGTLMTLTYGYDSANQLTSYSGPEGALTYTYDNDGQLTNVGGARAETYSYDTNGNRTMSGWTTGTGNRLTADGTYTYSYDNDGNMVGRTRTSDSQVTTYTYDYRNRLTEVLIKTSGGVTVQDDKFAYDAENRRIGKNTLSGGQTWTVYDGPNAYADFNSSGSLTMRYLMGPGLDFLLGHVDPSGNPTWYLTDNLGSVRMLVDSSGNNKDQLTYDSYGNILTETNSANGDRFKFTGREWDSEIGQYYYRSRYYAPSIGRFESEDPISFDAGDTDLYRYVRNYPTGSIDPTGNDWLSHDWYKFWDWPGNVGDALHITAPSNAWLNSPLPGNGSASNNGRPLSVMDGYGAQQFANTTNAAVALKTQLAKSAMEAALMIGALKLASLEGDALANKLHHIFRPDHPNVMPLVTEFGSQEKAFQAIQQATLAMVKSKKIITRFTETIRVGSRTITVQGTVIDGRVYVNTAW